jgi:transcriptional regulator with XRE-family HTH domain
MLQTMGNQIRLARLRRNYTMQGMAEHPQFSRSTITKIEAGDDGVAIGSYFNVLIALALDQDILLLAKDDALGRKLQDAKLEIPKRAKS